ncbi:MAG: hypothetical protein KIT62_15280 [Cyclobacteriaceae bacterium]|nr:hypothetical protein [Cyclobacteriaceae bacterium]
MKQTLLVVIIGLSAWGCKQAEAVYDKPYFDFDSLVNRQQQELLRAKVTLNKIVILDVAREEITFEADSIVLMKELDVFRQLDVINKPGFADSYNVMDGEKDTRSNLTIRKYATTEINSPVPYVLFYYQNDFGRLHRIESTYRESNTLYGTERNLLLEFDDASGKPLLARYKLTGVQKMVLSDSVTFSVEGTLVPGIF